MEHPASSKSKLHRTYLMRCKGLDYAPSFAVFGIAWTVGLVCSLAAYMAASNERPRWMSATCAGQLVANAVYFHAFFSGKWCCAALPWTSHTIFWLGERNGACSALLTRFVRTRLR